MTGMTRQPNQPEHPAKYSAPVLDVITDILETRQINNGLIIDPFAGTGRIHQLATPTRPTIGVEIETEWADMHPNTIQGDSTQLAQIVKQLDLPPVNAIITSPAYGNRMADRYAGDKKGSRRHTYRVALGRDLAPNNGAGMQWGENYRQLHQKVWEECQTVLADNGWLILNISDHIRGGQQMPVVRWHFTTLLKLGFKLVEIRPVHTARQRHGANGELRVPAERVIVLRKPPQTATQISQESPRLT